MPLCQRLEATFAYCFAHSENTRLVGGASEPLYQPGESPMQANLLFYREDYFASALHEIAHWCIAGAARRKRVDFGYWYAPEGRSAAQQQAFEAVEIKPQALEWFFSLACGYRFRVSADNFLADGTIPDTGAFRQRVAAQAVHYQRAGLPSRAAQFFAALSAEFGTHLDVRRLRFDYRDAA
jgi:hypothetical protein